MWYYFLALLALVIIVIVCYSELAIKANRSSKTQQATLNSLAKLPAEVRIQIFKHYFAAFRPERYYREYRYKEAWSLNLLIALRGDSDLKQYFEASEQYRTSSHLLLHHERGIETFKKAPSWAIQSIKDVTFGPSIFEHPIIPNTKGQHLSYIQDRLNKHFFKLSQQYFTPGSKLGLAKDLQSLTIYLRGPSHFEIDAMIQIISMCFWTFKKLFKISFCFPSKRNSINHLLKSMSAVKDFFPITDGTFTPMPKSIKFSGCRHEIIGFEWGTNGGRLLTVEFEIYYW